MPQALLPVLLLASVAIAQGESAQIPGFVRDGAGKPVAGAEVRAFDLRRAAQLVSTPPHGATPLVTVKTDAKGRFRLAGLPEAGVVVEIEKPGFFVFIQPFAAPGAAIVAPLIASGYVAGRVTDGEDRGVSAQLTVYYEGASSDVVVETDGEGRFRFHRAHVGRYAIRARAGSMYSPVTAHEGDQDDLSIRIAGRPGSRRLLLRAADAAGKPVKIFRASALPLNPQSSRGSKAFMIRNSLASHADGTLRLQATRARNKFRLYVIAAAEGFADSITPVPDRKEETTTAQEMTIRFEPASAVVGRVVDARSGKPVDGVTLGITASGRGGASPISATATAADGTFRIGDIAEGETLWTARRFGAVLGTGEFARKAGGTAEIGDLPLRGFTVGGKVTDLPAGVRLGLRLETASRGASSSARMASQVATSLRPEPTVTADAAGSFSFSTVPTGKFELFAAIPQAIGDPVEVVLASVLLKEADEVLEPIAFPKMLARVQVRTSFPGIPVPEGRLLLQVLVGGTPPRSVWELRGPSAVAHQGAADLLLTPGAHTIRAVDLATGAVLQEAQVRASAGKQTEIEMKIPLGLVRVEFAGDAALPAVSHLGFETPFAEAIGMRINDTLLQMTGLPINPGTSRLDLLLPTKSCTLRLWNGRVGMVTGGGRGQARPVATAEVTADPAKVTKIEMRVAGK